MNLVGASTIEHIWDRHFSDSAQLLSIGGKGREWLDIGAGAGFPGLIVALLDPLAHVTLVESIAKKCSFLKAVVLATGCESRVDIANQRVESLPPRRFDVITARACAALDRLFDWGLRFADPATRWVLPKGSRHLEELDAARRSYDFDYELIPSVTDPAARVVVATTVRRL